MHGTMMGNIESMRLDKCNAFMVVGKSKLDMLHSYSSHFSKSPTIIIDDLLMLLHNATMRDGESLSLPTLWEYKHHVFTVVIRKSDLLCIHNGLDDEEAIWTFATFRGMTCFHEHHYFDLGLKVTISVLASLRDAILAFGSLGYIYFGHKYNLKNKS